MVNSCSYIGKGIKVWRCNGVKGIHGRRLYLRGPVSWCLKRRLEHNGFVAVSVGVWTWAKEIK